MNYCVCGNVPDEPKIKAWGNVVKYSHFRCCAGLNKRKNFCSLWIFSTTVPLSNFIFPMNGMFNLSDEPHNENEPTKCQKTCFSNPTPRQKREKGEKKSKLIPEWKCRWNKKKLLAFSYLFVPLLFLGMKGERQKEKHKEQINIDMTTRKSLYLMTFTQQEQEEEQRVSKIHIQNNQSSALSKEKRSTASRISL